MSLTSYRAAPPRVGRGVRLMWLGRIRRPGGDLLSRALRHSTMGAGGFHGRVREGIGCGPPAKATRSSSPSQMSVRVDRGSGCVFSRSVPCPRNHRRAGALSRVGLAASDFVRCRGPGDDFHAWCLKSEPIGRSEPVSFMGCPTSTPGLSTWWSSTALREISFRGKFPA